MTASLRPVGGRPVSYLAWNAARFPERPALIDHELIVTFRELFDVVLRLSAAIQAAIDGEGVVAVNLANTWEYVASELAIPNAGGVVMPLPLALGSYEVESLLRAASSKLLIVGPDSQVTDAVAAAAPGLRVVTVSELLADAQPTASIRHIDLNQVVEISLTSGTTGLPKLASHSARQKQATFEVFTQRLKASENDLVLSLPPLTQGVGGMAMHCLRLGAGMAMYGDAKFTTERAVELSRERRPTLLVAVPTNLLRLLESPSFDAAAFESVRAVAVAGSLMPADAARRWEDETSSRVCIFYGSMDAGHLSMISPGDPDEKRWHTVGRIQDRCEVMIAGADGRPVLIGEVGEICMRGETVQVGYWGTNRTAYEADGWAHLGDLGSMDADGYLHVVGRLKDIIIRGGSKVNPYELETVLRGHAAISDVCVVGKPDPSLGERVVAFVVCRPGADVDLESIRAHLASAGLSKYKWPESVVTVDEIPLSGPGKVNRRDLRERAAQP